MDERLYELIFICRPDTPEEEIDKIVAALEQSAAEKRGKLEKVEKWGTRKLAYRVRRHREGSYVYLVLRGKEADMIKELERRLRVADPVIKYLTVRLDEELKRQQKLSQRRDRKVARRPRKAAPTASGAGDKAAAS
jgi:small subunit ribosomal protein S6